jgi:hypothetical protein
VEKEKKIIEKEKGKKGQGLMSANTRKTISCAGSKPPLVPGRQPVQLSRY